jgi:Uma2 family endonuclease
MVNQTTLPVSTAVTGVSGPPQGHWMPEDFELLPEDDNRYELIDGVLYMSTAPSYFHQWVVMNVHDYFGVVVKKSGLGFPAFAPIGVYLPDGTRLQPDYLIVLAQHSDMIHDRRIHGAPDIVIEVLSPGSDDYDQRIKKAAYQRGGVPEYAVIDPGARALYHYRLESGVYGEPVIYGEGQTMTFAALPTIPLAVSDLFAGSPDTTL